MTKIPSVEKVVEQLAQQEWLMIGDVPTAQHWLRKALTTYAQTVAEEAVRVERERIKKEITEQTLLNDGDNTFVKLGEALWVCDSKKERAAFMKALTPLPDKE
jgi:hypothetical protein